MSLLPSGNTNNGTTMHMTDLERFWAWEIKHAVENDPELENLSDFEYAHHSLVTQGDLDRAMYNIQGLQDFRKEYRISRENPVEQGVILLKQFMEQQPWFVLDVAQDPCCGHNVVVEDYKSLNPSKVRTPDDWRVLLGGGYYLHQLSQPNLHSVREGVVRICECDGLEWKNFSTDIFQTGYYHLMQFYPMRHKEITWVHASVIGNLQHSLFKTLFRKRTEMTIQVGCQFQCHEGRIDEVFKSPNPENAKARLLSRMRKLLTERYYNEISFNLPAFNYDNDANSDSDVENLNDDDEDEEEFL